MSLQAFYGGPGDEGQLVSLEVTGLGMAYEKSPVKTVRCHHLVAGSLLRVLTASPKISAAL